MLWLTGINSLRFFAIFLIVVYHLFHSFLPGGFIAVEIFFTISGFLVVSKLARELAHTRIKYRRFISRRFLRVFPSLLFCVLLTLCLAFFVHPDHTAGVRQDALAAISFTTNIKELIIGRNYENSISPNLFEHTWFLALEMQFYLLVPLLMSAVVALFKKRRTGLKVLGVTFLGISVLSYVLMAVYGGVFAVPDRAYFALDSHLGAFCLGAAYAIFNYFVPRTPRTPKLIPALGVILSLSIISILAFKIEYNQALTYCFALPFSGFLTVVMLACIIKLQPNIHTRHKTLSFIRITEVLGRLAFGIYLFHWPLFLLLPELLPSNTPIWGYATINIIASIALAIFCQHFFHVERKLSMLRYYRKRRYLYIGITVALLIPALIVAIRAPKTSSISQQLASVDTTAEFPDQGSISYFNATKMVTDTHDILSPQLQKGAKAANRPSVKPSQAAPSVKTADVLVLGDSVTLGAKANLESTIPKSYVDAKESRSIITATSIIAGYAAQGKLPNTIVISLATNEYNITDSLLQSIVDAAGSSKTFIFVTAYAGPQQPRERQNAAIKSYAAKHDNVYIADWWELAHADWSLMYADHIHLNPEGRTAYANLVYNTVKDATR